MRHALYGIGLLLAFTTGGFLLKHADAAPPTTYAGRWQIVQGPPTGLFRTFLLDTASGQSFIVCTTKEKIDGWCQLEHMSMTGFDPDAYLKQK
jgi:hypothetical protein